MPSRRLSHPNVTAALGDDRLTEEAFDGLRKKLLEELLARWTNPFVAADRSALNIAEQLILSRRFESDEASAESRQCEIFDGVECASIRIEICGHRVVAPSIAERARKSVADSACDVDVALLIVPRNKPRTYVQKSVVLTLRENVGSRLIRWLESFRKHL